MRWREILRRRQQRRGNRGKSVWKAVWAEWLFYELGSRRTAAVERVAINIRWNPWYWTPPEGVWFVLMTQPARIALDTLFLLFIFFPQRFCFINNIIIQYKVRVCVYVGGRGAARGCVIGGVMNFDRGFRVRVVTHGQYFNHHRPPTTVSLSF